MTELKVYLPAELDERFRKHAMTAYGFGRGSLSKAAEEAIRKWCQDREQVKAEPVMDPTFQVSASPIADKQELPKEPAEPRDQTGLSSPTAVS